MPDHIREHVIGKKHYRTLTVERQPADKENRVIKGISFSSETPVIRFYGIEVLSHDPKSIRTGRMANGLPLLKDHNRDDQRGRIENIFCDDKKRQCIGDVRFSRTEEGEKLMLDIEDGIRPDVSCGYMIYGARELKPEEMTDELKNLAVKEQLPVIFVNDWEMLEGSSVSIPADTTVGFGRDYCDGLTPEQVRDLLQPPSPGPAGEEKPQITINNERKVPMEPTQLTQEEVARLDTIRVNEIRATGEAFKERIQGGETAMKQLVETAITLKRSADLFRGDIYTRVNDTKPLAVDHTLGLSEKEKQTYSVRKVIHALASGKPGEAPFEMECSAEIAKRAGAPGHIRYQKSQAFWLPPDIKTRNYRVTPEMVRMAQLYGLHTRDLSAGSATQGADIVGTQLDAANFIDLLRNEMVFRQAGARVLEGLVGNIAIPKQTGASTFYYAASEGAAPTESDLTFDQLSLSPNIGGTSIDYTYQLMLQSTPSVDGIILDDLAIGAALGMDLAGFHGSGGTQPTGIASTSNIGAVTGTDLAYDGILNFISDVWAANAKSKNCKYVTEPTTWALLKNREKFLGSGQALIDDDNNAAGFPVLVSNQITSGYMFFGDFSQAILAIWGDGVNILVDPYTASAAGTTKVRMLVGFDIGVRIPGAFSVASSIT